MIHALESISKSLKPLAANDRATYSIDNQVIPINKNFHIKADELELLLIASKTETKTTTSVVVKKPDYLGKSKWHVHYLGRKIEASIHDAKWLANFQAREVHVRPQDSLDVNLVDTNNFGHDGSLISISYIITKVHSVSYFPRGEQMDTNIDT